jgi:acyl-CoA reductase-like NAD-dependent aldehyde dehydrogenase
VAGDFSAAPLGNGLDPAIQMGPLANARRIDTMQALVADAKARGARVVAGGARIESQGYYFPLTVLADVPDDARAMQEEPFGPLALLSPVRDLDEAIDKANSLPYGLAGYAFTTSAARSNAWPTAWRSATCPSTTSSPPSRRRPLVASRKADMGARAAWRASSITP